MKSQNKPWTEKKYTKFPQESNSLNTGLTHNWPLYAIQQKNVLYEDYSQRKIKDYFMQE